MEMEINSTPEENPVPLDRERELLKSPIPVSSGEGETKGEVATTVDEPAPQNRRLPGASRKRLSRLLKRGIPYETALRMVLEGQVAQPPPERRAQTSSGRTEGKRVRSDGSTPDQQAKKPRGGSTAKPTFSAVAEGVRVGIIHPDYPATALDNTQLGTLQRSIMKAVEAIPDGGPQVRFQGCTQRPGWLLITCADQTCATWLESEVKSLQPWDGARLKLVQGADLPKPHIYVAYIPDDNEITLTSEEVLTRLRKMNHGLNTREWKILHREKSGPGQTWTFSVDETSMSTLERLGNRPYFGFGQVQFRKKARGEKGKIPAPPQRPVVKTTQESGSNPPPKVNMHRPSQSGKGKTLPTKPSLKKRGKNPPSRREQKPPSPQPPPTQKH